MTAFSLSNASETSDGRAAPGHAGRAYRDCPVSVIGVLTSLSYRVCQKVTPVFHSYAVNNTTYARKTVVLVVF